MARSSSKNSDRAGNIEQPSEFSMRMKEVEYSMYHWKRDGLTPEQHKELESEWNRMKAMEDPDWTYRHDRRDEFTIHKEHGIGHDGKPYTDITVRGTTHPRDTTIDWRTDTQVGKQVASSTQQGVSKGTGDHAGHLVASRWGIDPGLSDNLQLQNHKMNQGKGWKSLEDGVANHVNTTREPASIEVKARLGDSAAAPDREQWRTMEAKDKNGEYLVVDTSSGRATVSPNLAAGNFSTPARREAAAANTPEPEPPTRSRTR